MEDQGFLFHSNESLKKENFRLKTENALLKEILKIKTDKNEHDSKTTAQD